METKSILKSKTFWVNIIGAILGVLAIFTPQWFTGIGINNAHTQTLALAIIGIVVTILNIVLRIITHQPINAGEIGTLI